MEEQNRTTDSMDSDSECILPHDPSDDENYPPMNEGRLLEAPTVVEKMDSSYEVEIKEEVGELFMGNEETPQTVFPTGLILINDQATVGTTQAEGLSYTSIYNDKTGSASFLQASQWECSIVQSNESVSDLEMNEPSEEGNSEFVRRFSHRVVERIERDPLAMSTTEISNNLSTIEKIRIPLPHPRTSTAFLRNDVHKVPGTTEKQVSKYVCKYVKRGFKCTHCKENFQRYWQLVAHEGTHNGSHKCSFCDEEFFSFTSFRLHKVKHLEVGSSYKCKEKDCNKSYTKSRDLRRHMQTHTGKHKCDECDKEYLHDMSLLRHKKEVHGKNKRELKCEECGKILVSISALELHMGIHTGEKKYKCLEPGCEKSFASSQGFKDHKDLHDGKGYNCNECGNVYLHKKSLVLHKERVHKIDKTEHKCEECGKILVSILALELHMGLHTGEKKYKCLEPDCDKSFASQTGFRAHNITSHKESIKYKCDGCESGFYRSSSLMNHKETVHCHSDSVFQCKLCEKSFTQAQKLTNHSVSEHDKHEENFKCRQCNKTFVSAKDHKRHILTHEKRFKCQKCEEAFSSATLLRSHVIFKHRFDQDVQEMYWQQKQ